MSMKAFAIFSPLSFDIVNHHNLTCYRQPFENRFVTTYAGDCNALLGPTANFQMTTFSTTVYFSSMTIFVNTAHPFLPFLLCLAFNKLGTTDMKTRTLPSNLTIVALMKNVYTKIKSVLSIQNNGKCSTKFSSQRRIDRPRLSLFTVLEVQVKHTFTTLFATVLAQTVG